MTTYPEPTVFIDAFIDFSFKRLFFIEESKPILIGLLNHLFKGRKFITAIEFGKTEYHGEHPDEGGAIFDVNCTDIDGSHFIIEVQRGYQKHFKERALFYTSKVVTEEAPKGDRKNWNYNLKEVYLIAFMENFSLPGSPKDEYIQDICLADRHTGKIFYDKLGFTFIQMLNFVKRPEELHTDLDKWLYALKHLSEFTERPAYLSGKEFDQLFNMAKYTNLTKEERDAYNKSLKHKWDNKNVMDYAVETAEKLGLERGEKLGLERGEKLGLERGEKLGLEQGEKLGLERGEHKKAIAMAAKLKAKDIPVYEIAELTDLSVEEIESL